MNNLVLNQTTDQNQARLYIQKIYDLVQSGEEFPVDLDEVWMIKYSGKNHAVYELQRSWRENYDYKKNFDDHSSKTKKGRPPMKYFLTVNCFEHFIARHISWLFEIYRRTFHGVLSGQIKPSPESISRKQLAQMVLEAEEEKEKALEEKQKALQKAEAFQNQLTLAKPKIDFADQVMDSDRLITMSQAAKILRIPHNKNKQKGRNLLFKELRQRGIFYKDKNEPYQYYIDRGYFQLKEKPVNVNGNHQIFLVVLVTQKGLNWLIRVFLRNRNLRKAS